MPSKQRIKYIRNLQQKKYRDLNKVYLAEGLKIVEELISFHQKDIDLLVYAENFALDNLLIPDEIQAICIGESDLKKLSTLKNPQGILAIVKQTIHPLPNELPEKSLNLVLDSIRDPGNMGTIIRIADWFGLDHVFCSEDTVDCYNSKVVQASMGAIFRVKIHYTKLPDLIKKYKNQVTVYATTLQGENVYQQDLNAPALIILGSESHGVSQALIAGCDKQLLIPNYGKYHDKSESLNVSMATGIVCSEFRRQLG